MSRSSSPPSSSLLHPLLPLLLPLLFPTFLLSSSFSTTSAAPTSSSSEFLLAPMVRDLARPTRLAFAPDPTSDTRAFVVEKLGRLLVFDSIYAPESETALLDVFLDINSIGDRGLLGMAVTPVPSSSDLYVFLQYTTPYVVGNATCVSSGCLANRRVLRARVDRRNRVVEQTVVLNMGACFESSTHQTGNVFYEPSTGALYLTAGDGADPNSIDYGNRGNACGDYPGVSGDSLSPNTAEGGSFRSLHYMTRDPGPWKGQFGGTLVRLDLNGNPHPGNPDYKASPGLPGGAWTTDKRAVVAYGLRNPFATTWRNNPKNDGSIEVWIGDVGWNTWEEINRLTYPTANRATLGGAPNFGWPCYEGKSAQSQYQSLNTTLCNDLTAKRNGVLALPPFFQYQHGNLPANFRTGCTRASQGKAQSAGSITALHFVNTASWPSQYQGALLMGDFSVRCLWLLPLSASTGLPDPSLAFTLLDDVGVLDVKSDGAGVYVVEYGNAQPGAIYRLLHAGEQYFDARISANSDDQGAVITDDGGVQGVAPLHVNFDSSASFVSPGVSVTRAWDFDASNKNKADSNDAVTSNTYDQPGTFTATLTITGPGGLKRTDTKLIQVASSMADLPSPVITSPANGTTWVVGQALSVAGLGSHPNTDTLSWDVTVLHCASPALDTCHSHDYLQNSNVPSFTLTAPDHDFYPALVLELTVTTSASFSRSVTRTILPRLSTVAITSAPVGASVANLFTRTPSSGGSIPRQAVIGSSFYISASATTVNAGIPYLFAGWSDGLSQSHEVIVPDTSAPTQRTTYVAMYAIDMPSSGNGSLAASMNTAYVGTPFSGFQTQGGAWWDRRTDTHTVTGSGIVAGGTADSLYLVYKDVSSSGVVDILASITATTGPQSSASISIRSGPLSPKSITATLSYSSSTRKLVFGYRRTIGGSTTATSTSSTVSLPVSVGLRYAAGAVSARYSVDGGNTWVGWGNNAAPTAVALKCETGVCVAGAGVAAGLVNTVTQANFVNLAITTTTPPSPSPPPPPRSPPPSPPPPSPSPSPSPPPPSPSPPPPSPSPPPPSPSPPPPSPSPPPPPSSLLPYIVLSLPIPAPVYSEGSTAGSSGRLDLTGYLNNAYDIGAPAGVVDSLSNVRYTWVGWSDGGAREHSVTLSRATGYTYTAYYTAIETALPASLISAEVASYFNNYPGGAALGTGGLLYVTSGGSGVAGYQDQFHYVYEELGDGVVVAEVSTKIVSVSAASPSSNIPSTAGVMLRLSPGIGGTEANAHAYITSRGTLGVTTRAPDDEGYTMQVITSVGNVVVGFPVWLRLRADVNANTFTASYSEDGVGWDDLAMVFAPFDIRSQLLGGLSASAGASRAITLAVFDNIDIVSSIDTN